MEEQLSLVEALIRLINRRVMKSDASENSLDRVRGMLKPVSGEFVSEDAELSDRYTDYLFQKYA
ncbi:MAG: hypothetical protein H6642_17515 [Caldilineaceae bacterium]|nr:hypothetical protein [Caldilineaceae bacterium]